MGRTSSGRVAAARGWVQAGAWLPLVGGRRRGQAKLLLAEGQAGARLLLAEGARLLLVEGGGLTFRLWFAIIEA